MNKTVAINSFNEMINRLARLPLISDQEMNELFGEEVSAALGRLAILDQQENICSSCREKCCRLTKCELFSPRFEQCPIHELRPALCRLHYCVKYRPEDRTIIKELGDIFFECLTDAQSRGNERVKWFDSPPLAAGCPELVRAALPWVEAVENGMLEPKRGAELILKEAEKHRTQMEKH